MFYRQEATTITCSEFKRMFSEFWIGMAKSRNRVRPCDIFAKKLVQTISNSRF